MPVTRIERIEGGRVTGEAKRAKNGANKGKYRCFIYGSNVNAEVFDTLDEVAAFLRANSRGGVRMTPNGSKIVDNIFINGIAR